MRRTQPPAAWPTTRSPHEEAETVGGVGSLGEAPQLPALLRIDVQTAWIHKGDQAFGGGNNDILIHTDAAGYRGEWLEETIYHEACHTCLIQGWRIRLNG